MRKKSLISILIIIVLLFLNACQAVDATKPLYTVMLPDGEGYSVISNKIVSVERGKSVEFEVEINEGYEFLSSSIGEFSGGGGTLLINNVKTGTTVKFTCVPVTNVIKNIKNATVEVSPLDKSGKYIRGTKAKAVVTPFNNYYIDKIELDETEIIGDFDVDGSITFEFELVGEQMELDIVALGDQYNFGFSINGEGSITADKAIAHYGEVMTFEFLPSEGKRFSRAFYNGQRIFPENNKFSVTVEKEISVVAYFIGENAVPIYFYENIEDSETYIFSEEYPLKSYANLYNCYSEVKRDGYVCVGVNTEPDGSGESYNFGALFYITEEMYLYAQWEKETEPEFFEYTKADESITILGFSEYGKANEPKKLVIPQKIDDEQVTKIDTEAFKGSDNVELLIMSDNITALGERAFESCDNLKRVILTDSIETFPTNVFDNNPVLKTIELNSIYDAVDGGYLTSLANRFAQLKLANRKSRYILISGSSGTNGIDAPYFNDNMDKDILVIGVHLQVGLTNLLSIVYNLSQEGDIIIITPEFCGNMYLDDVDDFLTAEHSFPFIKKSSNVLKYIDYEYSKNVIDIILSRMASKKNDISHIYNIYDEYGVISYYRPNKSYNEQVGYLYKYTYNEIKSFVTSNLSEYLLTMKNKLNEKNIDLLFSYPPMSKLIFTENVDEEYRKEFEELLQNELNIAGVPLISTIENYIFNEYLFWDCDYHPSSEGALLRTQQLVKDLKAYYNMEEN